MFSHIPRLKHVYMALYACRYPAGKFSFLARLSKLDCSSADHCQSERHKVIIMRFFLNSYILKGLIVSSLVLINVKINKGHGLCSNAKKRNLFPLQKVTAFFC